MPSAVEEIGGLNLISWTFALYLAGSISAATSISLVVANLGLRATMMRTAIVFSAGCVVVASAPLGARAVPGECTVWLAPAEASDQSIAQ